MPDVMSDAELAELGQLRSGFGVDRATAEASNDYEKLIRIAKGATEQWRHGDQALSGFIATAAMVRQPHLADT